MNIMDFLQGLFGGNTPTPRRNPLNFALGDFLNRLFPSGTSVREQQTAGLQNAFNDASVSSVRSGVPPAKPDFSSRSPGREPGFIPPYVPGSRPEIGKATADPRNLQTNPWGAEDYAKMGVTGLTAEEMRRFQPGMFAPQGVHPTFGPMVRNPVTQMRVTRPGFRGF